MDYKAALAAVRALDNGAELEAAIAGHVSDLEAKNFTVIGEKRAETQKRQAMQSALEGIGKSLGIEGDVEAVISSAQGKVQTLASDRDAAISAKTDLETRATEAEGKVATFQKQAKFTEAAAIEGANAAVLERLFGDKADDIEVNDGKVTIGGKTLKEYVEGDDQLTPFMASLFPKGTSGDGTPPKKKTELPGGPPDDGSGGAGTDPMKRHIARHRGGAAALMSKQQ